MKEIITCVKQGEEVHVTQNGEVVAAMLHPSRLKPRVRTPSIIAAEQLTKEMARLKDEPLPEPGLSMAYAEDLVQHIRTERDSE